MSHIKIKIYLLTLAFAVIISVGFIYFFTQVKEVKIFGCTQSDIFVGPDHTKMAPVDVSCNLSMLDLSPTKASNDRVEGLVQYDLNMSGDMLMILIFAIAPLVIAYILILTLYKLITLKKSKG